MHPSKVGCYLVGMKNREERSQHFFDTSVPLMDDGDDAALYGQVCADTETRICLFFS